MIKRVFLGLYIVMSLYFSSNAQISINNNGNLPDPSAIVDIQATDRGLLIPRIDFNDRPDPAAAGLLVYVTANGPLGDNALYMYNGTSWVKFATEFVGIGSHREGGVVFYYNENQGFGLVSSADVDENYTEYGCFGTLVGTDGQHTEIGFGEVNTGAILQVCSDPGIAADYCDQLDLNGYTDWFLPTLDELLEMYTYRNLIGGFTTTLYWSSTESEFAIPVEEAAWIVNFNDGTYGWTAKSNTLPVRCVRKFNIP